jgi:hypothetical protein
MNIFGTISTCKISQSDLAHDFKSVRNTNTCKSKKVIYSERNSKTFKYHRDSYCFLMLEPIMASIYITAYQPAHILHTHTVEPFS